MEIQVLVSTLANSAVVVFTGVFLAAMGLWFFDSRGRNQTAETRHEEREHRAA